MRKSIFSLELTKSLDAQSEAMPVGVASPLDPTAEMQKLQADYEVTVDQIKTLTDIRFKLLAFVPTLAGTAIAFLDKSVGPDVALLVGCLGFVVTIGITIYDIRNSQLYDAAIHRVKALECFLELPIVTKGYKIGGLYSERPARSLKLFGILPVWHDRGLSLSYGAALGGWTFIIVNSAIVLQTAGHNPKMAFAVAAIVGLLFSFEYVRLNGKKNLEPTDELKRKQSAQP